MNNMKERFYPGELVLVHRPHRPPEWSFSEFFIGEIEKKTVGLFYDGDTVRIKSINPEVDGPYSYWESVELLKKISKDDAIKLYPECFI